MSSNSTMILKMPLLTWVEAIKWFDQMTPGWVFGLPASNSFLKSFLPARAAKYIDDYDYQYVVKFPDQQSFILAKITWFDYQIALDVEE